MYRVVVFKVLKFNIKIPWHCACKIQKKNKYKR